MARSYLDHASTSPLRPAAHTAMVEYLDAMADGAVGDPGRIHEEGMRARSVLEDARDRVASWLGVRPRQIVFTSGATESIAMAHHGALARSAGGPDATAVLSAVEHSAVTRNCDRGANRVVGVDASGRVDPARLLAATGEDTAVVHLQHTNHELGVTQPIAEVVEVLDGHRCLLHVDAAQSGCSLPGVVGLGADLVSVSGHKLGGPAGAGLLVLRRNLRIPPLLVGGDQERARRAGLENIAAVLGLAAVADELASDGAAESARLRSLSQKVIEWADSTEGVSVLGDRVERSDHLVCVQLEGIEPQPVLLGLDQRGVAVHSGSSCSSEAFDPSPVLEAIGADAQRSLRISVGWSTTPGDVDRATSALTEVVAELRTLGASR